MKCTAKTDGDYFKGMTLEVTPIELLAINRGLRLIYENPESNLLDKDKAKSMYKDIMREMDRIVGKDISDGQKS